MNVDAAVPEDLPSHKNLSSSFLPTGMTKQKLFSATTKITKYWEIRTNLERKMKTS
jgi:hypothetical protein